MHKLLARQLRRFFGGTDTVPAELRPFFEAVDAAYEQSDVDRAMLEHSMEMVSLEMADRHQGLRDAIDQQHDAANAVSLLSATLESTADGILVVDSHGKIVRFNSKFAELWRLPQSTLADRDDAAAIAFVLGQLSDPDAFGQRVQHLYDHPEQESFDVLQFKDGRVFERYSLPQRVGGVTVGRVWSFRDVTERRKLEEQLRQSLKMEAIGLLAGGIAHDFNNLLTVIRMHAELLTDSLDVDDQRHAELGEVITAADRATALTRQLLAFSRKQHLQTVVFDLNQVVTSVEPMLRRLISEDIEISTLLDAGAGLVLADRHQMEQVIVNLAINARDAMPRGGRLSIRTSNVALHADGARPGAGATPPGNYVLLALSDTGTGIPREHLVRIFEPFFTTKELGKGTGLGLSTIYGIVKQLNGYIWAESEEGAGSTFSIYLPRVTGPATEAEVPLSPVARLGGSETILVAEDEDSVRRLLIRILSSQGYAILSARDGEDALEVAANHGGAIDLLITDMVMPGISGLRLAERLREKWPGARVLFLSGYTEDEIGRRGVLPAGAAFLHKPFTIAALAAAVQHVLGNVGPIEND